jgi:hypothetical protein
MDTRKARGPTAEARKTIPKEISSMRRRLEAMEDALEKGAGHFAGWVRKEMPAVKAGFARFGRTVARTAAAIEEEVKDDVAGMKKRLAERKAPRAAAKKAAPKRKAAARKPAAKKPATRKAAAKKTAAKKPAARKAAVKKPAAKKKAPVRRKAAAKKATGRPAAARKKAAPRRKAAGAAR